MNAPLRPRHRPLPDDFIAVLTQAFGESFSTAEGVRAHHGNDESHFPDALPDAVVWPHSTSDVVTIVNACHEHRVPIIPYGVGSSLERRRVSMHLTTPTDWIGSLCNWQGEAARSRTLWRALHLVGTQDPPTRRMVSKARPKL